MRQQTRNIISVFALSIATVLCIVAYGFWWINPELTGVEFFQKMQGVWFCVVLLLTTVIYVQFER